MTIAKDLFYGSLIALTTFACSKPGENVTPTPTPGTGTNTNTEVPTEKAASKFVFDGSDQSNFQLNLDYATGGYTFYNLSTKQTAFNGELVQVSLTEDQNSPAFKQTHKNVTIDIIEDNIKYTAPTATEKAKLNAKNASLPVVKVTTKSSDMFEIINGKSVETIVGYAANANTLIPNNISAKVMRNKTTQEDWVNMVKEAENNFNTINPTQRIYQFAGVGTLALDK